MKFPYEEFDLAGVKTYPLASRQSKARHEDFATAWDPATSCTGAAVCNATSYRLYEHSAQVTP